MISVSASVAELLRASLSILRYLVNLMTAISIGNSIVNSSLDDRFVSGKSQWRSFDVLAVRDWPRYHPARLPKPIFLNVASHPMKQNPVKRKLKAGEPTFGTWLSLSSVFAARFLARVGFDWLTVDLEHSPTNWETAAHIFGAVADAGGVPLARVPRGDHDHIKRVLDSGAMGIVAPMVNSLEEARAIVAAAKYPPIGNRSVGGSLHALNYGATAGEYLARANNEVLVILQTEHPIAVDRADEMYAIPGVDAIFVGPNDLAANLRRPDGTEAPSDEFESTLQRILAVGKKTGTPVGLHTQSPQEALSRAAEGWQFLAIGSELRLMLSAAQDVVSKVRPKADAGDVARY